MTHAELIQPAARWLGTTKGYPVVLTELVSWREEPDVLGWKSGYSALIECKATRADYRSDAKKTFRRAPERGLGQFRYYCTPTGLLSPDELPERWGLIVVGEKGKARLVKKAMQWHTYCAEGELYIMGSVLRRIGHNAPPGVNIKTYSFEIAEKWNGKSKATLGVATNYVQEELAL